MTDRLTRKEQTKKRAFEVALGRAAIAWNQVEYSFSEFVAYTIDNFHGAPKSAWIAAAEMGSRQLREFLEAYAHSVLSHPDEKAHILHVTLLHSKWSLYRNTYLHGIKFVHADHDQDRPWVGSIASISAKSKLQTSYKVVTVDELKAFEEGAIILDAYIVSVRNCFLDILQNKPPLWPPKPPEPDALSMHRHIEQGHLRPPQA